MKNPMLLRRRIIVLTEKLNVVICGLDYNLRIGEINNLLFIVIYGDSLHKRLEREYSLHK